MGLLPAFSRDRAGAVNMSDVNASRASAGRIATGGIAIATGGGATR
jgi:hypothetical protein